MHIPYESVQAALWNQGRAGWQEALDAELDWWIESTKCTRVDGLVLILGELEWKPDGDDDPSEPPTSTIGQWRYVEDISDDTGQRTVRRYMLARWLLVRCPGTLSLTRVRGLGLPSDWQDRDSAVGWCDANIGLGGSIIEVEK